MAFNTTMGSHDSITPAHQITYLRGEENFYTAAKTFKQVDDGFQKISDYRLGKYFCHSSEMLIPGMELKSLHEILLRVGEETGTLRIYGKIRDFARGDKCERNGEFLEECPGGDRLLVVDVDGWDTDIQWWSSPDRLRESLHGLLSERDLQYLSDTDCVCMLSQGAFPGGPLKCHLYFWLERGRSMEELRAWGKSVNTRLNSKEIDGAVYRLAQPDYQNRRVIDGGKEPFNNHVHHISGGVSDNLESIDDGLDREISDDGHFISGVGGIPDTGVGSFGSVDATNLSWRATVAKAGTDSEINEWCYRGAAKLVQKRGTVAVLENLRSLAIDMHKAAWVGIVENSHGARGGQSDRETYVVVRFEQYLRSACDRKFGDDVDRHVAVIDAAVKQAETEGPGIMMRDSVVEAGARLRNSWPEASVNTRAVVMKVRGLPISSWDKAIKGKATMLGRVASEEAVLALEILGDSGGATRMSIAAIQAKVVDDGHIEETLYIDEIMRTFEWFLYDGERWLIDLWDESCVSSGGYKVIPFSNAENVIMKRAMEILAHSGVSMPDWATRRVMGQMVRASDDLRDDSHGNTAGGWIHGVRALASRYYNDENTGALWVNLGVGSGGKGEYKCLRSGADGVVDIMTWAESLEGCSDAPMWHRSRSVLCMESDLNFTLEPGRVEGLVAGEGLRGSGDTFGADGWATRLFRLVRAESRSDEDKILAWLVSVILGGSVRYLLQVVGSPGSGKSVAADILRGFVDPLNSQPGRMLKDFTGRRYGADSIRSDKLVQTLKGSLTSTFDNISGLSPGRQDRLCGVATGLSSKNRVLYTNIEYDDVVDCSLVLTGISPVITREDLMERVINISVRPPESGAGFMFGYSKTFEDWRHSISAGILDLAVLVSDHLRAGGITGRKALMVSVKNILNGEVRAREDIIAVSERDSTDLLLGNHFGMCFSAFLMEKREDMSRAGWLSMGDIMDRYMSWFTKEQGKKKKWLTPWGEEMSILLTRSSGQKQAIPSNLRSFGTRIGRCASGVSTVTAVVLRRERMRNQHFYQIEGKWVDEV